MTSKAQKNKKRKLSEDDIEDILNFIQPNPHIPKETAMVIVEKAKDSLRNQLKGKEIYPKMLGRLKEQVRTMYLNTLIQPGESVGIITAQSIGEKQTQSNLNSVDWREEILYVQNSYCKMEPIGKMIDTLLETGVPQIFAESHTEYLEIKDKNIFVPSADEDGNCGWYKVEAVTKHYPKGKLVKITTQSGRTVTATQDKSFVTWNGEKFVVTLGSDIAVGDIVPSTVSLPSFGKTEYLDMRTIFSPQEYDFSNIVEHIPLDKEFGFLVGIYLAEGWNTEIFLGINNNVHAIRKRVTDYCDRYGIITDNGASNDLKVHSDILARLFKNICDEGSSYKKVPLLAYTASEEFVIGLLDGYFSGVGTVNRTNGYIIATSTSVSLLKGIAFLLTRFGIFSKFVNEDLTIANGYARTFAEKIFLTEPDKQNSLTTITLTKEYGCRDFPHRDVYFDPVVSVEYVDGTTEYVYDLTVEKTRYFQLYNGLTVNDTFHKAGSSDKQPVVSKFSELLNATINPKAPFYLIRFKYGNSSVPELRETIGHSLVQLNFKRIVKDWEICVNKEPEEWYEIFYLLYGEKEEHFTDCISLELDMDILFEYKLTMAEIAEVISREYSDSFCVFSPDCFGRIDIYFDTRNIDLPEEKLVFVTQDNASEIYLEEVVQPILESVPFCGISGITNMFFVEEGKEWVVETENSREKTFDSAKFKEKNKAVGKEKAADSAKRYKKVLAHPAVDMTRTISNNVWDIYYTFGVEAARQYMIDEFAKIMEGINFCHIMLLVDKMTFLGTISSISRYTMRTEESGPFGKASFEETLDNFLKAGVFGQEEQTRGVSASIICGKIAPIGTGMCDLAIDVAKLATIQEDDESDE
jgi:intein/homing endonuclease